MHQTILYIWSKYDGHTPDFLSLKEAIKHLGWILQFDLQQLVHEVDTLLREAIIETDIEVDAYCKRLATEFQYAHQTTNTELLDTCVCLLELVMNTSIVDVLHHLARHQIMHHAISALTDGRLVKEQSLVGTRHQLFFVLR